MSENRGMLFWILETLCYVTTKINEPLTLVIGLCRKGSVHDVTIT